MLGLVLSCTLQAQIPSLYHTLDAYILDEEDQKPIHGADIFIMETGNRAMIGEDGLLHLHMSPGSYSLQIRRMGYLEKLYNLELTNDTTIHIYLKPSPLKIEEIVILSPSIEGELRQSSMNAQVLDREYLERNYNSTFSQGIEKLPGLNSITTGVGIAKPVIRGLQGNRITVNDRGVRQEGQQWGSDHGLEIDPYAVDRVEIIRGAASLLYGSDAMGGVINLLEPQLAPKGSYQSSVLGVFRGNNDHIGTSVHLSGRPGDTYFAGRATWQEYGDYRVPADEFTYNGFVLPIEGRRLKNTAGRERHFSAEVGRVLPQGNLRLSLSNYSQETGLFPGAVGIPRSYALVHDGSYRNVDIPRQVIDHFKAILNARLKTGPGRLEIDAGYQRNNRREESFPHVHGQGPSPEGNTALGLLLHTFTVNTRYSLRHNERWKTVIGINSQYQENERSGFEFLLADFRTLQAGLSAMSEYRASDKLNISFGLRHDYAEIDVEPYFMPIYASPDEIIGTMQRGEEVRQSYSVPTAAAGLSWNPQEEWNFKLNLGRSFRFPTAPELGMNGIHHGTFRHEVGSSELEAERGWQVDAGAYYRQESWSLSLTPYWNYFDNFIFLRPTATFSPLPEAGQLYRYTQARAVHTGAELALDWQVHPKLNVTTSGEYVYNINLDNGLALPFTPPLLLRSEVTWHLVQKKDLETYLFAEAVVAAAQNRTDRNEPSTPGYEIFNAGIAGSRQWGRFRMDLQIQVRNLADTFYLQHLSRYRLLNLPEPGRNAMVSLKLSWL